MLGKNNSEFILTQDKLASSNITDILIATVTFTHKALLSLLFLENGV